MASTRSWRSPAGSPASNASFSSAVRSARPSRRASTAAAVGRASSAGAVRVRLSADDARPTTATVDARLDALTERTAELSEAFETGDPAGDLHDRVDTIEAGLEVVAGDIRSVRSELASVEERLAELERFRVSTPPRGSDEDDDPTAALPEPPVADRPSTFDDR